ncbi:YrrS family protein [Rossellomorea aquimaris]|uniref:YrrS family protein n=1 Tax=Rossellomorea aquimaris TaxID=189382 RepID=UPI0007D0691F|nr:YrrS family protein [Rossellomorea aquimaris]
MAKYKSRLDKRSKKNTNKILNILIAVVVLLIVVVGGSIIMGNTSGDEKATSVSPDKDTKNAEENSESAKKEDNEKKEEKSVDMKEEDSESESTDESSTEDTKKEDETSEEKKETVALESEDENKVQVEESDEPNVKKNIVHPDWKPVGTDQTGEHVSSYDTGSVDWQEKIKAMSYATGISEDNMTVWYIEGNGGPQKSLGTITSKDQSQVYRVHLQWVDGEGWKPTKVQELVENDKD